MDALVVLDSFAYTPPARLPSDVPEKTEGFLRVALLPASCELLVFCSVRGWVGRARPAKAFVFSHAQQTFSVRHAKLC
jgi:hypothetical protein